MSRDEKKVDDLLRSARVVQGSFEEPAILTKALELEFFVRFGALPPVAPCHRIKVFLQLPQLFS